MSEISEPQEPQNQNESENNSTPSQDEPTRWSTNEVVAFMADFLNEARNADEVFRANYCELVVNRIFDEFGHEGLCNLMMAIDQRANWISDILIEDSDIDNILFKTYGTYDPDAIKKARDTDSLMEMNSKLWKLRKKYARIIAHEIACQKSTTE
jgi:hypothetical protein